jgi:hypothetical protein
MTTSSTFRPTFSRNAIRSPPGEAFSVSAGNVDDTLQTTPARRVIRTEVFLGPHQTPTNQKVIFLRRRSLRSEVKREDRLKAFCLTCLDDHDDDRHDDGPFGSHALFLFCVGLGRHCCCLGFARRPPAGMDDGAVTVINFTDPVVDLTTTEPQERLDVSSDLFGSNSVLHHHLLLGKHSPVRGRHFRRGRGVRASLCFGCCFSRGGDAPADARSGLQAAVPGIAARIGGPAAPGRRDHLAAAHAIEAGGRPRGRRVRRERGRDRRRLPDGGGKPKSLCAAFVMFIESAMQRPLTLSPHPFANRHR